LVAERWRWRPSVKRPRKSQSFSARADNRGTTAIIMRLLGTDCTNVYDIARRSGIHESDVRATIGRLIVEKILEQLPGSIDYRLTAKGSTRANWFIAHPQARIYSSIKARQDRLSEQAASQASQAPPAPAAAPVGFAR
jgi:hypothetical protein